MKRFALVFAVLLFALPAHAACPLTKPILVGTTSAPNVVDDYYSALQWQQTMPATFIGPAPFVVPINNPTVSVNDYLQEYSYSYVTGKKTPIDDNAPTINGVPAYKVWTLTQSQLRSGTYAGCWEGSYAETGIKDESYNELTGAVVPFAPVLCVYGDAVANTCVSQGRVNASEPGELLSYEVIDSAGNDSGEIHSNFNCIRQGPPNNVADRGAFCENTYTGSAPTGVR